MIEIYRRFRVRLDFCFTIHIPLRIIKLAVQYCLRSLNKSWGYHEAINQQVQQLLTTSRITILNVNVVTSQKSIFINHACEKTNNECEPLLCEKLKLDIFY